ncbi:MAG: autotransporter domain-containing protein [Betaproteobacteria bacterium]|nr:autotransporter domain-containing protein [Betaproteobacteria bacterium]
MKSRIKSKLLPALVTAALGAFAAPSQAAQFTGVFIFGDSLSDAGYFRPALIGLGVPANVASTLGRFTTNPGPVWSEIVSQRYGVTPRASNDNSGNIFAQGGARVAVASTSTPPGAAQRPVSTQITEFLARSGGADPGALYGVWAGANDIFQTLPAISGGTVDPTVFIPQLAGANIQQIGRLRAAGARYILVFNLPDLGITPQFTALGPATAGAATALAANFNTALFAGLQSNGIGVIPVDTFSLLNDVRANAAAFGFTNITGVACGPFPPFAPTGGNSQFCNATNLVAQGAATSYLFADGVHPTTGAHRVVGDYVISLIEGPQQYSLLAEAPLRSRESHVRTLDAGLLTGARGDVGKWTAFAAVDGGKFDIDASGINPQLKSDQKSISVGGTLRVSEAMTVGVAVGKSENEASFGGNLGRFDTEETVLSAFGSMKWGGFYANAALSVSDVDFENVQRNIQLGQVLRTARGSTNGSNSSGHVALGYDFAMGKVTFGPQLSVTSQNVTVNDVTEEGAGSANLKILKQTRNSTVTSFGLRASMDLGNLTPFVRVTYDQEQKGAPRDIGATPLSVATGNTYTIPGYVGDERWSTATVGLRGTLGQRLGFSVVYSAVQGKSGVKQDGLAANIAVQF